MDDYGRPSPEEYQIAGYIAETLLATYPGYPWAVSVSEQAGTATVQLDFSGSWGFLLHLKALEHDIDMKLVKKAGGEMLERYKLRRGMADESAIYNMQVDFTGLPQPSL